MEKSFNKTASLMTYSCAAAAILSEAGETEIQSAHSYGRNIGIAFQLVDDLLDFVSSAGTCQASHYVIAIYLLICKSRDDQPNDSARSKIPIWLMCCLTGAADQLGKPAGADLQLGLATAPVLFASRQFPQLNDLIARRFR